MSKKKEIVVTGMGAISSVGCDVDTMYENLLKGKSGISTITEFPCDDYPTKIAGVIRDFDPTKYLDKKQARRVDPFIAYGIASSNQALTQAHFDLQKLNKKRVGVILGTGMGGMQTFEAGVDTLRQGGWKRVSPFFIPYVITNIAGALLAIEHGFMGPNYSISTACATGTYSIISAANHIRKGDADVMVCGGVEAPILPMGLAGFCACRALSRRNDAPEKASRPWDRERDGFVMGEGAGVLVLESREHAEARGAKIIARYLGGAFSCDAYHMTDPHPDGDGVAMCIQLALEDGEVSADAIDYVNAHGTSTPVGDMAEVYAMKRVFPDPSKVVMNSTKSMLGHCLGAAGGLEAVVTLKAITEGVVHPTINLEDPEPDLEFHVPKKALKHNVQVALSNSFGFGGHNATAIFGANN